MHHAGFALPCPRCPPCFLHCTRNSLKGTTLLTNNKHVLWTMQSTPSPNPILILIRHGETDWNKQGRTQGQLDTSRLTSLGISQAKKAALALRDVRGVDHLISSPLQRALDTMCLLVKNSGNGDFYKCYMETDENLKEMWLPWQGLLKEEARARYKEYDKFWEVGGIGCVWDKVSPIDDLEKRAMTFLKHVCTKGKTGIKVVVAHNQINKMILLKVLGCRHLHLAALRQGNCCFNVIELREVPVLHMVNYRSNLFLTPRQSVAKSQQGYVRMIFLAQNDGPWSSRTYRSLGQILDGSVAVAKVIMSSGVFHAFRAHPRATHVGMFERIEQRAESNWKIDKLARLVTGNSPKEALLFGKTVLGNIMSEVNEGGPCLVIAQAPALRALITAGLKAAESTIDRFSFSPGGLSVVNVAPDNGTARNGSSKSYLEVHNVSTENEYERILAQRVAEVRHRFKEGTYVE